MPIFVKVMGSLLWDLGHRGRAVDWFGAILMFGFGSQGVKNNDVWRFSSILIMIFTFLVNYLWIRNVICKMIGHIMDGNIALVLWSDEKQIVVKLIGQLIKCVWSLTGTFTSRVPNLPTTTKHFVEHCIYN